MGAGGPVADGAGGRGPAFTAGPRPVERDAGRDRPHRSRVHREPLRAGALRGGAATSRPTSRAAQVLNEDSPRSRDRAASRTTSCRSGWSPSASACPATSPRRSPSGRSSATTTASCCSCSGPTRDLAVPDRLGRRRLLAGRGRRQGGRSRRPASSASPAAARRHRRPADGLLPLRDVHAVFHCQAVGGELRCHPLEYADVGWFGRGRPARPDGRRAVVGADGVRRDQRRGLPTVYDEVRSPIWRS